MFDKDSKLLILGSFPSVKSRKIDFYYGNKLVLINKSATPRDKQADLLIQAGLGEVFSRITI